MNIRALFRRKEPELELKECTFDCVVVLSTSEYERFRKNLLDDYEFIRVNKDRMGVRDGVIHCILVMGERSEDGILVNSEGANYARYTAHFPGASAYIQQQHREEMHRQRFPEGRLLTQADVNEMRDKHTKWLYEQPGGERADFTRCYLAELDLHDMAWNKACFRDAVLENVNLKEACCHGADFAGATFIRCDASSLLARGAGFSYTVFEESDFTQAKLEGSHFYGACIKASDFQHSSIWNTEMEQTVVNALKQAGAVDQDDDEVLEPARWTDEDYHKMTFGGMV